MNPNRYPKQNNPEVWIQNYFRGNVWHSHLKQQSNILNADVPILTFWRIHFLVFRFDHNTIRAIWRITINSGSCSVYHENGRGDCGNWLELCLYLAQQLGPNWVTVMPPPVHFWCDCRLYLPTSYMWDMTYPALARNASMTWKHTQVPLSWRSFKAMS